MTASGRLTERVLRGAGASVTLSDLNGASGLGVARESLRGRSIVIATQDQLTAAVALLELDGIAARLVLCPPGFSSAEIAAIARMAAADVLITEAAASSGGEFAGLIVECSPRLTPFEAMAAPPEAALPENVPETAPETEWVLLTSGTTGAPKLVLHTLSSLAGDVQGADSLGRGTTWATFYDVRRYGGLQILLRALLGGGSLVLSEPEESVRDHLLRVHAGGVTHITGTPSHWRRVLMSGCASLISPSYVRLSGEIADQGVLDALRAAYPSAAIAHAFASTEGGLVFDVTDGLAGFPEALVGQPLARIEIRIEDGSMLIRSARAATRYLNPDAELLRREDGFVDTRDLVELRHGRYFFVGRRGGTINIGGLKCHPEEIESVINQHPSVQMSRVKARKSPLLGSVVLAEVVLKAAAEPPSGDALRESVKSEILENCRRALSAHKVPATIRIVESLAVAPSGKLLRQNA